MSVHGQGVQHSSCLYRQVAWLRPINSPDNTLHACMHAKHIQQIDWLMFCMFFFLFCQSHMPGLFTHLSNTLFADIRKALAICAAPASFQLACFCAMPS